MNVLYTTEALATGGGRDGHVAVAGTDLAFDLAVPTSMGGSGNGLTQNNSSRQGSRRAFIRLCNSLRASARCQLMGPQLLVGCPLGQLTVEGLGSL